MDGESFRFIIMPDLFIAACAAPVGLLWPCKDAGGWGVDETFLCLGGILWGERCLFKGGQRGDNVRTMGKATEI